jgi:hypothetical protein
MIRYALSCSRGHLFDAWFKTSANFDNQSKRGLVACPRCGATDVHKALMAPSVKTTKGKRAPAQSIALNKEAAERVAAEREMAAIMRRIRAEVEEKAEYVGSKFVDEARKIHYEESPARGIYGEATLADAEALAKEGIDVLPLPVLPEDRN